MGHFYTREGEARHFVEMKTRPGELRPTRVSDARKEGWIPSVTTILDVLAKHALVDWKINEHLKQAYQYRSNLPEYVKDTWTYLQFIKDMTEQEMDKAPSAGTDLHNLMEKYWKAEDLSDAELAICKPIAQRIMEETGVKSFEAEITFACESGFAGMVDLCSSPENAWVIDYKTKQTKDKFKPGKMAYPDHARQLAAYREGLGIPFARCANVFVCLEDGEIDFHEHKEEELMKGWHTFMDCLSIWQRENYDSRF